MLVRIMNWVSQQYMPAPFMCLFLLFGSCGSSHKSVKSDTKIIQKIVHVNLSTSYTDQPLL